MNKYALEQLASAARAAAASIENPIQCLQPGTLIGRVGEIVASSIGPEAKIRELRALARDAALKAYQLVHPFS